MVGDPDGDPDDAEGDVDGDPLEGGGADEGADEGLEAVGDPDAEWLARVVGGVAVCADEAGGNVPAC